jgi:N-acetyl-beta-hexosaminidase
MFGQNIWVTRKKVDYMIFPRMTALSETLWSAPEKRTTQIF